MTRKASHTHARVATNRAVFIFGRVGRGTLRAVLALALIGACCDERKAVR
jgi:hypothetical protein